MIEIKVVSNVVSILIGNKIVQTIKFDSTEQLIKFLSDFTYTQISEYVYQETLNGSFIFYPFISMSQ